MAREFPLNHEGALAPSEQVASPLLRMLLVQEAEAVLAQKYPTLFFEPELNDPVIPNRELTDEEEEYRLQAWAQAAVQHEHAVMIWRGSRETVLDLEVARLYRRYLKRSQGLEQIIRRTDFAAGISRWLDRQRALGAFGRIEARMFLYLMVKAVVEDAHGGELEDPNAWGGESFQSYIDHITATYDGDVVDDQLVAAMNLYRRRDLVA
jgi:hypothetical protein